MLSRRGWQVLAAGVAVILLGRILGLTTLYVVGTTAVILCVGAVVWIRLHWVELDGSRQVQPLRVQAGAPVRVELTFCNRGRRGSPALLAADSFDGGHRIARFVLAALDAGEVASAAYRLPTERRGVFWIGPLELELRDPFGLASARLQAAWMTRLVVLPHIDPLPPPPPGLGIDPDAGTNRPSFQGQRAEDFYALRQYVDGDDLRRVHWPSTARRGELMIRQDERPRQERVTVLVDNRSLVHDQASLEGVVSAAASVVASTAAGRQTQVRMLDADGNDTGYGAGPRHIDLLLDRLAEVGASNVRGTGLGVSRLRSQGGAGTLVVVTTDTARDAGLQAVMDLQPRFSPLILIIVEDAGGGGPLQEAGSDGAGNGIVVGRSTGVRRPAAAVEADAGDGSSGADRAAEWARGVAAGHADGGGTGPDEAVSGGPLGTRRRAGTGAASGVGSRLPDAVRVLRVGPTNPLPRAWMAVADPASRFAPRFRATTGDRPGSPADGEGGPGADPAARSRRGAGGRLLTRTRPGSEPGPGPAGGR